MNKILYGFLETIASIADRAYQERVWVRGEGPECDDYTESICHFFDDGDPVIANHRDYGINDHQLRLLTKLRESVQYFNSTIRFDLGPDFLNSSEWIRITLMARDVLRAFHYPLPDDVKDQAK